MGLFTVPGECDLCVGKRGPIFACYTRSGWGRTRTQWSHKPYMMCADCRRDKTGHWKRYQNPKKPSKRKAKGSELDSVRINAVFV
jgi:hypothetical protein